MHSFTDSDLSNTDNIVPFWNVTSINLLNLLCLLLFCLFILINWSGIFDELIRQSADNTANRFGTIIPNANEISPTVDYGQLKGHDFLEAVVSWRARRCAAVWWVAAETCKKRVTVVRYRPSRRSAFTWAVPDLGICETSYSLEASCLQGPQKISDLLS